MQSIVPVEEISASEEFSVCRFLSLIFSTTLSDSLEKLCNGACHNTRARLHSLTGAGVYNQPFSLKFSGTRSQINPEKNQFLFFV